MLHESHKIFRRIFGSEGESDYGLKEREKIDDRAEDREIDLYTYVAEITYCCYCIPDQLVTFAT